MEPRAGTGSGHLIGLLCSPLPAYLTSNYCYARLQTIKVLLKISQESLHHSLFPNGICNHTAEREITAEPTLFVQNTRAVPGEWSERDPAQAGVRCEG